MTVFCHRCGGRWRPQLGNLQSLEHTPGVGRAAGHAATLGLALDPKRHMAHRGQGFHGPRRREVELGFLQTPAQQSLYQEGQRSHKDMCTYSLLDLVIDWPHGQHVLEMAKSALEVG